MIIRKTIQCTREAHPKKTLEGEELVILFSPVQSLSRVHLFATPWTAARQASPSIATSQSLLELMSTEPVMHFVVLPYSFHPRPIPQRGKLSPDGLSDSSMSFALWAPTPALLGDFLTAPAGLFVGVWPWVGGGGGQILFHLVLNTISPHFPPAAGVVMAPPGQCPLHPGPFGSPCTQAGPPPPGSAGTLLLVLQTKCLNFHNRHFPDQSSLTLSSSLVGSDDFK